MLVYMLYGHKWKCHSSVLGWAYRISFRLIFGRYKFIFFSGGMNLICVVGGSAGCPGCWAEITLPQSQSVGQRQEGNSWAASAELPAAHCLCKMCGEVGVVCCIPTEHFIYYTVKIYEILTLSSAPNKFGTSNGYFLCKWETVLILTV